MRDGPHKTVRVCGALGATVAFQPNQMFMWQIQRFRTI